MLHNTHLYESERMLHAKLEMEKSREVEKNLERERERGKKHSLIVTTSLHSQHRAEEVPTRPSQLHGNMHCPPPRSGPGQQDRSAGAPVRPFSCFGANGLHNAHPVNDIIYSAPLLTMRASDLFCDNYSPSPHSVSASLSPAPSPMWSGVRAQHAGGDRSLRRRERELSEDCERLQVQQFNEMVQVQVRHAYGGASSSNAFRSREGNAHTATSPHPISAPILSPQSHPIDFEREQEQMEASYMDDTTQRFPFQFYKRHSPDVELGLVSRSTSYRSRDDDSESTLILSRGMLRGIS